MWFLNSLKVYKYRPTVYNEVKDRVILSQRAYRVRYRVIFIFIILINSNLHVYCSLNNAHKI